MANAEDLDHWARNRGSKSPRKMTTLEQTQAEAKRYGATLENDGHGGLDPKLAQKAFRKGGYKCARCGTRKNISLHHKGGIIDSEKLDEMGHENNVENIAVLCPKCHDFIHEKARERGIDSSQVKPKGDGGPGLSEKEIRKRSSGRSKG
jgi:5-methylcytosine-specific restriction endonuclease McrA